MQQLTPRELSGGERGGGLSGE